MPKTTASLPVVLTEDEVEALMEQPDTETPYGLRDRAILEVFYSTGIRRTELCRLELSDLSLSRLTLFIREGKGGKGRLLPLGHADFRATQVYTHVSIRKLQEIHAATHPARVEDRAALLSSSATAPCVALPPASLQSLAAENDRDEP